MPRIQLTTYLQPTAILPSAVRVCWCWRWSQRCLGAFSLVFLIVRHWLTHLLYIFFLIIRLKKYFINVNTLLEKGPPAKWCPLCLRWPAHDCQLTVSYLDQCWVLDVSLLLLISAQLMFQLFRIDNYPWLLRDLTMVPGASNGKINVKHGWEGSLYNVSWLQLGQTCDQKPAYQYWQAILELTSVLSIVGRTGPLPQKELCACRLGPSDNGDKVLKKVDQ